MAAHEHEDCPIRDDWEKAKVAEFLKWEREAAERRRKDHDHMMSSVERRTEAEKAWRAFKRHIRQPGTNEMELVLDDWRVGGGCRLLFRNFSKKALRAMLEKALPRYEPGREEDFLEWSANMLSGPDNWLFYWSPEIAGKPQSGFVVSGKVMMFRTPDEDKLLDSPGAQYEAKVEFHTRGQDASSLIWFSIWLSKELKMPLRDVRFNITMRIPLGLFESLLTPDIPISVGP